MGLWWGFFNFGFLGDMTGYFIKGFFVFCNVLVVVVVQVTAVCVLSVFIAPLLTVGLLPTTYYSAARRARQ